MGVSDWVISKIQCSSALIVGPTAFAPPLPLPLNAAPCIPHCGYNSTVNQ